MDLYKLIIKQEPSNRTIFAVLVVVFLFNIFPVHSAGANPVVIITLPPNADKEYQNEKVLIVTNANPFFDLQCSAPYPIQWVGFYEQDEDGTSENEKWAETRRLVEDFTNPSTYLYSAVLSLTYVGKIYVPANFSCQSINEPRLQTNVLMTSSEMKRVIVLEVSSATKLIVPNDSNVEERCPIIVTASDLEEPQSCWKCETEFGKPLEFDAYFCETPIECNMYYQRERRGNQCLQIIEPPEVNPGCRKTGEDFNPGFIACKNHGIGLVQFYYFSVVPGANNQRQIHFDWYDIDPQEMMYIQPIPPELFEGQNLTLVCEVSHYYFSFGVWFALESEDGEIEYIEGIEPTSRVETREPTYSETGTFVSNATFLLSSTVTKIYCFAPVWNSEVWINASVDISLLQGVPPMITSPSDEHMEVSFESGEQNVSLKCDVQGKPFPTMKWLGPEGSEFTTEDNEEEGWSQLIFKTVSKISAGNYTCEAISFLGSDTRGFSITVIDNQMSGRLVLLIILFALVLLVVVFIAWRKIRQQKVALRILTEREVQEFVEGNPAQRRESEYLNGIVAIEALSYDRSKFEISEEDVEIDLSAILGSGTFGIVYQGVLKREALNHNYENVKHVGGLIQVAVKCVKPDPLDSTGFKALLSEIKIMAYVGNHLNIVNLIGANTNNIRIGKAFIVFELCEKGNLETYLKGSRDTFLNYVDSGELRIPADDPNGNVEQFIDSVPTGSPKVSTFDLVKWSLEISLGMEYLHEMRVIHGDLALRNVLLTSDGISKIGDFGLSRQINRHSSNYFKKTQCPLPWKWMALESLEELQFSVWSDMWAFGITLWEIFSLAEVPYKGSFYGKEFLVELKAGTRLEMPSYSTNSIYEFMLKCWNCEPSQRPGFNEIQKICKDLLKDTVYEGYFIVRGKEVVEVPETQPFTITNAMATNDGYQIPSP